MPPQNLLQVRPIIPWLLLNAINRRQSIWLLRYAHRHLPISSFSIRLVLIQPGFQGPLPSSVRIVSIETAGLGSPN